MSHVISCLILDLDYYLSSDSMNLLIANFFTVEAYVKIEFHGNMYMQIYIVTCAIISVYPYTGCV